MIRQRHVLILACLGLWLHCGGGSEATPDGGNVRADAATPPIDAGIPDATVPGHHQVNLSIIGEGAVTIAPLGLTCSTDCAAGVLAGTSLTLTAEATPPSTFAGWTGACAGLSPCDVVVDGDIAVGAAFGGHWSTMMGGPENDAAAAFARVGTDHLMATGPFQGTAHFGPLQASSSRRAIFIVMLDAAGTVQWLETIRGLPDRSPSFSVRAAGNTAGDVIVGGTFNDTLVVGGVEESAGCCNEAIFASRFSSEGDYVWSTSFVGDASIQATKVAADNDGNVFVIGTFRGTMSFGDTEVTSVDGTDGFLVALAGADGAVMWVRTFDELPRAVAADDASVFIAGDFADAIELGGDTVTTTTLASYAARYESTTGAHMWSSSFGEGATYPSGLDVHDGVLIVVGQYDSNVTFGSTTLLYNEPKDDFVASLVAADGSVNWANRLLTGGKGEGPHVSVFGSGRVAVAGKFRDIGLFGGSLFESTGGSDDIYVAVFDADGNHVWSNAFGTATSDESAVGVAVHSGLQVAIGGWAHNGIDFGDGPLAGTGGQEIFVANLLP